MNINDLRVVPVDCPLLRGATFLPDVGTLWRGKQRWCEAGGVTLTNRMGV